MRSMIPAVLGGVLSSLVVPNLALATMFCGRSYNEMSAGLGYPYSAVGYLNNGCTAFLIDRNHIATAAHCVLDTTTGQWQKNGLKDLRFYLNFHPSRVANDENRVPRADVVRAVVGSRAGESVLGAGMDWAIAYVDNWRDIEDMDLQPLKLARTVPATGTPLTNPAYTRHHFPYNDNSAPHWDDMEWDAIDSGSKTCYWVNESTPGKKDGGMWAIIPGNPPKFDGTNHEAVGCNQRWGPAYIHSKGAIKSTSGGVIRHNVDTIGGSSGSPLLFLNNGAWQVVGVGHGGGGNNFFRPGPNPAPTCAQDTASNHNNVGASVERFRDAPRFAANVAVYRAPQKRDATAVFAIDSDLNQVAYRYREGNSPTYTSPFTYWRSLGSPSKEARLTRIAACSADSQGRPQVFALDSRGEVWTRSASALGLFSGGWTPWTKHFAEAGLVDRATDIDASTSADGKCQLFLSRSGSGLYTSTQQANRWSSWQKVAAGMFFKVSAIRTQQGVLMAAVIDKNGKLWRTARLLTGWQPLVEVNLPSGYSSLRDIDFTWDEAGRPFMVALPTTPTNGKLYFMPLYGDGAWREWRFFNTSLWAPAPGQPPQPAPHLMSITASRWMEDRPGVTSPVVFATGDEGNVYFVEYSQLANPGWRLTWKSFYHETVD